MFVNKPLYKDNLFKLKLIVILMFDKILSKIDINSIMLLAKIINNISLVNNNVYTIGVGKSQHVARLFSDQLKLLSIVSMNLNITNLSHGDIGIINENDLIIIVSKSGNTEELIDIIPTLKDKKGIVCLISMNSLGIINKMVSYAFILPKIDEIDSCNLIPTNSILVFIHYFNKVVLNLISIKNLKPNTIVAMNHPGGDLGKLSKIHT